MRNKLFRTLAALTLLGALAGAAFAQAADAQAKAEQILKQARAAIGDESKLKALQGLSATGTARQTFGEFQSESEIEVEMLFPDKIRISSNNQMRGTNINVLNGDQAWRDFIPAMGGPGGGGNFMRGGPGGPGGPGGGPGGGNPQMAAYMQLQQRRDAYQLPLVWLLTPLPTSQVQFAFVGEAQGPNGKVDVLDGKGANGFNVRLYIDQQTHQLVGLSYKAKSMARMFARRGPGGGPGGPGGPGGGQGGQRAPQPGAGPGGQGQQGQRPQMTEEERQQRAKEMMEAFEKAPEVDFRWALADYKNVGGLNLPHRLTKLEGGTPNEEWEISKFKVNPKIAPDKFVRKERPPQQQ